MTIGVPSGIKVVALWNTLATRSGTRAIVYISSLDVTDQAPDTAAAPLAQLSAGTSASNENVGQTGFVLTNTSSQIRVRANGSSTIFRLSVLGWIDNRGKE